MNEDMVRVAPPDARHPARAAYGRAVGQFLAWCEALDLVLTAVSPLHVAAYIRTHPGSAPTVKQHLAAIRMLSDWLVVSQVLPVNPAAAVRGPKHVVTKGATPVLSPAEARRLLEAIDPGTLTGRRDRVLVSVMLYSFARVSAVIGMRRQDYFRQERQGWLRLHEKGGTRHDVPAHHRAAEALDDYLARAGLDAATAALFQSVDPAGRRLTGRTLSWRLVLAMIKRRAAAADLQPFIEATASGQASDKRRRLDELMHILQRGDRVVVSELSRLGRSLGQIVAILDALAKADVAFVALKEHIRVEGTRDIQTTVMTTLFALFAEVERDLISERTREGLAQARASGKKLGRPKGALGVSRLDGKEDDIRRVLELGVSKTAIAKITGVSRTSLYSFMRTRGLKPSP